MVRISLISLYNTENVSIRSIHAHLKEIGCCVQVVYFKDNYVNHTPSPSVQEIQLLQQTLEDFKPDIIGFSVGCSALFDIASFLTQTIRSYCPAHIAWGGVHPTICPEQCIEIADIVCVGEGEIPLQTLAAKISAGSDITGIPGLWVRNGSHITRMPCGDPPDDLDRFSLPDYSNENKILIDRTVKAVEPQTLTVWQYLTAVGRGCSYRCAYCLNSVLPDIVPSSGIRRRSVSHVIAELLYAKKMLPGMRRILFIDEIFPVDRSWIKEFAREYRKKIHIPFGCLFAAKFVRKEILDLLTQAGLNEIYMGIQSGSDTIRQDLFNRKETGCDIIRAVKTIRQYAIDLNIDMIFDNPYETEDDKQDMLDLLLSLKKPFNLCLFPLIYFPKTVLTQRALKENVIDESDIEGNAQRSITQWALKLDTSRSSQELFWICLASFTGKHWIPNTLIRWISRNRFFHENPRWMVPMIKMNSLIQWMIKGFPVLFSGHVPWRLVKKRWRHLLSATK
jgi:radical SAM superfamily enzyme YgiQ (UPF0313 family)